MILRRSLTLLLEQEFIDKEQKQCIRVADIKRFCDSKLGRRVAKADTQKEIMERTAVCLFDGRWS